MTFTFQNSKELRNNEVFKKLWKASEVLDRDKPFKYPVWRIRLEFIGNKLPDTLKTDLSQATLIIGEETLTHKFLYYKRNISPRNVAIVTLFAPLYWGGVGIGKVYKLYTDDIK